ncbi:MAG: hypothetical protein L0216_16450, partial [Planctomycetales bacterium]|nr:hypothetical protein [Planctomycetales bacterium]
MDKFLQRFQANPSDAAPFEVLKEHYYNGKHWPDLLNLYVTHAQALNDRGKTAKLFIQAASVAEKQMGKPDKALELLERAHRSGGAPPDLRKALLQRYSARGDHAKAAQILATEARTAAPGQKKAVLVQLAQTWARAREHGRAVEALEQALALDPKDASVHETLAEVLGQTDRVADLGAALERWASALPAGTDAEKEAKAAVLRRAAEHAERKLSAPEKAQDLLAEALALRPRDREALEGLARLAETRKDPRGLVDALERRAEVEEEPAKAAALHHRIGRILEEQLRAADAAAGHYRRALALDSGHGGASAALEQAYEREGKVADLADLHSRRAAVSRDPAERAAALRAEAELREGPLGDAEGALRARDALLALEPADGDSAEARVRLLERLGRHAELVAALLARAESDVGRSAELRIRAGAIAEGRLGDARRAAEIYGALLDQEPGHREAAESLARVAAKAGDPGALARALGAELARRKGAAERLPLLPRYAAALAGLPARAEEAAAAWEEVLSLSPTEPEAYDALARLYSDAGRFEELAALYRRLLPQVAEPSAQAEIHRRLGEILRRRLSDPAGAEAAYRSAVRLEPGDRASWAGLRALALERGDAAGALEAARREAEAAEGGERLGLQVEAGALAEERLGRDELAAGLYREALAADPAHEGARERLAALLLRLSRGGEAADVLVRAAEASAEPGEALALGRRAADLRRSAGDREGAAAALEAGLRAAPDAAGAAAVRDDLAHLYESLGKDEAVASLHREAAERETDPVARAARLRRAAEVLHARCGDPVSAVPLLRAAVELSPRDPEGFRLLAEAGRAAGDAPARLLAARGERACGVP